MIRYIKMGLHLIVHGAISFSLLFSMYYLFDGVDSPVEEWREVVGTILWVCILSHLYIATRGWGRLRRL